MPNLSIRTRLLMALLLIIVVGGGIQGIGYFQSWSDLSALQSRSASLLELRAVVRQLQDSIDAEHDGVTGYILSRDPSALSGYRDSVAREAELVGASTAIVATFPEAASALHGFRDAASAYRIQFLDPTVALVQAGNVDEARSAPNLAAGDAMLQAVADARAALDRQTSALSEAAVDRMDRIVGDQAATFLLAILGSFLVVAGAIWYLSRSIVRPLRGLLSTARLVEAGHDVPFHAGGDDEIGRLGQALERMRAGLYSQATEGRVVNRYTELTAFVEADGDVARATLDALQELAGPDDGSIHISNRSKDRALPEGSIGEVVPEVVSLGHLSNCPGVRRSSLYVSDDLAERLSVRCPLYGSSSGTLACIPLIALGEVVGVVHLHWTAVGALPLDIRGAITRVTEHASLAIANRRLMTALQGMATTDGRTGLANSRSFDETLENRLTTLGAGDRLAVLMLDIDYFKAFNDRNGHPAGDQALRTFARVLQGAIREGDIAARYGGEEFVVMLPGATASDALEVAERIRSEVEATTMDLSPGHRDQLTVSIGLAMWPTDADDRVQLLQVADAALYRAKNNGRNRVVVAGEEFTERAEGTAGTAPGAVPVPRPTALRRAG